MTAIGEASRRCVVWFGQPTERERISLADVGWATRIVDAEAGGGVGKRHGDIVVALADLRCGDAHRVQAIVKWMAEHPHLLWLTLLSPDAPVQTPQVECLVHASMDCFTAPLDLQRLIHVLRRMEGDYLPIAEARSEGIGIDGCSEAIGTLISSVRKYAPVDLPVLITGETGTGKEVAARALHGLSARAAHPFAAINCGALPPNLVQSELFGHERGAFTGANVRRIGHFETAAGGTVFLDEIGDLPLDAQTSLLRFLQEGTLERVGSSHSIKLDVRVLSATHIDLEKAVAQGRFREDLYYRLNVLRLRMPALRERESDVELLAQRFLDAFRVHHSTNARTFSRAARQAMRNFAWPGNIRELLNRVQRAAVVAEDVLISAADLDLVDAPLLQSMRFSLGSTRVTAERDAVITCLRESRFNVSECARRLRVSRVTIYRLCKKHQLALSELR
ncbi:sigma-54 interaction domain-containing protein [Dyella tabacisoli]|uniref:Sigma-54-dependent Fis family transcriptional regulator n=1 Tax=Dyella tabacisoli TaxID=2282381 RepID=A0A369UI99_9GAMM|nr:sigma-54 dependent transcriptional regulator [Dyella tabacisoli]RDD80276.1 sigma-54-dependent Fis family transcriptional regulator [Dyella tabacisoli]